MSKPVIPVGSSVGFVAETVAGTRQSLSAGAFVDLVEEALDYKPVLHKGETPILTRQAQATHEFVSHHDGGGNFACRLYYAYASQLIALALGGTNGSAKVPILTNAELTTATLEVIKAGIKKFALIGAKVNKMEFTSEQNLPLVVSTEIISMSGTRDISDQTTPSYSWLSAIPFMHGNMTCDATGHAFLGGASGPEIRKLNWSLNNNLDPEGFTNSTTRKVIPEGIFSMEGSMEIPFNATTAAFWAAMVDATKVKFSVTYSDGTHTLLCAFVVKLDGEMPKVAGTETMWLTLNFHGVADDTDDYMFSATIA